MKKELLTASVIALCSLSTIAQVSVGGSPYSQIFQLSEESIPEFKASKIDMESVNAEDIVREQNGDLPLYGRLIDADIDVRTQGQWETISNGDRVVRMKITSGGAKGIELFFDDMYIPEGGVMYIYDESKTQIHGGFTTYNNHESGAFTAAMIIGESCYVEYYEPASKIGEGRMKIGQVGHAYRMIAGTEAKAQDCEVDVNCSPEGDGWHAERDGVVRISVVGSSGLGWCTGSVVNNTNWDCTPYVLTAWHCSDNSSAGNFNNYKFYFRYQRPGCELGTALVGKVMTGCDKVSDSAINPFNWGSDFVLLEINNEIPNDYTPFFAGWDAGGNTSGSGKCIHHPSGDEKKISTYTQTTQNATWSGTPNGYHWRVFWSGTTNGHGVTEGGSSGSPLYNNDGYIIGTLTGGSSFCNSVQPGGQLLPDFYGKMDKHWDVNGSAANKQLKPWLDPNNTGTTILDGSHDPCGMYSVFTGVEEIAQDDIQLYPNPANGELNISLNEAITNASVRIVDALGREVLNSGMSLGTKKMSLDISGLRSGHYVLQVLEGTTVALAKPFMKSAN